MAWVGRVHVVTVVPGELALPASDASHFIAPTPTGMEWAWVAQWESDFIFVQLALQVGDRSSSVRTEWQAVAQAGPDRGELVVSTGWPRASLETVVDATTGLSVLATTLLVADWEAQAAELAQEAKALGLAWARRAGPTWDWHEGGEDELLARWPTAAGLRWP